MTPHLLIWSFGPKKGSVDGICHQTVSMNRFYLDVKTRPDTDYFACLKMLLDGLIKPVLQTSVCCAIG